MSRTNNAVVAEQVKSDSVNESIDSKQDVKEAELEQQVQDDLQKKLRCHTAVSR